MRILSKSKTIDQEPLQAGARNQLRIAIEERDVRCSGSSSSMSALNMQNG